MFLISWWSLVLWSIYTDLVSSYTVKGKGKSKGKGEAVQLQAWSGPEGSRKIRFPDFVTTAQYGGRLSALRTGRLYPPGNTAGTHFC
jgi:hypothetical protein